MTQERLKEVIEILSHYHNEEFVDYYQLFGFNKNSSIQEIKSQIKQKKLQVLFHPDQIGFVPSEYHGKYLNMIEVVKDVINTFDNNQNKESYDNKLEESKKDSNNNQNNNYYQGSSYNQGNGYNNGNSYNQNNRWEDKTEDLDEINFQQAIILNSEKYGFDFTLKAILKVIQHNSVDGFTRDNNVRNMVANINKQKLMKIIAKSSVYDNDYKTFEQVIMNYLTDFIYNTPSLRQQINYLEEACVNTINKYDLMGCYGQTKSALDAFVFSGDASRFTNTNNGRVNLVNNVDFRNANFFMQCSLNKERHQNPNFSYENIKSSNADISKLYTDELITKINNYSYSGYEESYSH